MFIGSLFLIDHNFKQSMNRGMDAQILVYICGYCYLQKQE